MDEFPAIGTGNFLSPAGKAPRLTANCDVLLVTRTGHGSGSSARLLLTQSRQAVLPWTPRRARSGDQGLPRLQNTLLTKPRFSSHSSAHQRDRGARCCNGFSDYCRARTSSSPPSSDTPPSWSKRLWLCAKWYAGDQLKLRFQEIMALEHEADAIAREVLLGLRTTFITPFDRADIQSLITSMDNSVDECKATAKAIMLFEMTKFEPDMRAMADAIVECSELAQRAVVKLSDVRAQRSGAQRDLPADHAHRRGRRRLLRPRAGAALPKSQRRGCARLHSRQRDL